MKGAAHHPPMRVVATALAVGCAVIGAAPGLAWADHEAGAEAGVEAGVTATQGRGGAVHAAPDRARSGLKPTTRNRSTAPARPAAAAAIAPDQIAPDQPAPRASAMRRDPFSSFLANATPALTATQTGQSPQGTVTGILSVTDDDGDATTAAVTRNPDHGRVVLNGLAYTYTPDPLLAHQDITDSFQVTVSDAGSGVHVHGLLGVLNLLTFGLLGAAGHSSTATVRVSVAPFNNAPSGSARVGDPDPLTGTVTGTIAGSDVNGDVLSYRGSAVTAKGAVTVSATGDFSYTPDQSALDTATAPGATAADRQDSFIVTIDDGWGGVTQVPVTVTIGAPGPSAVLSTFCGCTLMPADTVFHADVSALPVLPSSSTWTGLLGGTLRARWGGTPWMGSVPGIPVNVVTADHPTETVVFNRGYSTSGPSIDATPYAIPDYPLVEGMPDVPAWDRHLLVFQEGTCVSQELYNVANGVELPAAGVADALGNAAYAALYGSAWIAEAGVHVDMNSGLYPAQGWANASRLPYLPLILRPDDLERGSIDHMLGMSIAKDRGTGYTWPARAGDGTGTNPDGVPMGTVFRLKADFPIENYDPATQVVLRALQRHGAVVYDSFSAGQDGAGLLAMSNGWSGTAHLTAQRELSTIPLSAFEAVDVLSLASDPGAGWIVR